LGRSLVRSSPFQLSPIVGEQPLLRRYPVIQGTNALRMEMLEGEIGDALMIPTRTTASGAPRITRAFAMARSTIRVMRPCSMSEITSFPRNVRTGQLPHQDTV
jgi:hypothetical protein